MKQTRVEIRSFDPGAVGLAGAVLRNLKGLKGLSNRLQCELAQGYAECLRRRGFGVVLHTADAASVREQILELARKRFNAVKRKSGLKKARFKASSLASLLAKVNTRLQRVCALGTLCVPLHPIEYPIAGCCPGWALCLLVSHCPIPLAMSLLRCQVRDYVSDSDADADGSDADADAEEGLSRRAKNSTRSGQAGAANQGKKKKRHPEEVSRSKDNESRTPQEYLVGFTMVPPNVMGRRINNFAPVRSYDMCGRRKRASGVLALAADSNAFVYLC